MSNYQKRGREFGNISQSDYLRLAQDLRDAPVGGPILEAIKPGGVISRFDPPQRFISAPASRPHHPHLFHPQLIPQPFPT
jgi:hypothetical protein